MSREHQDWLRDRACESAMEGFTSAIDVFLHGPAMWRCSEATRRKLLEAKDELEDTKAHIVRVWD